MISRIGRQHIFNNSKYKERPAEFRLLLFSSFDLIPESQGVGFQASTEAPGMT